MSANRPDITVQDQGDLATLILDNPARNNAISVGMWDRLLQLADDLAARDGLRLIIFRGAGERAFSAGADISEFDQQRGDAEAVRAYDRLVESACRRVEALPVPTLAMIHGYCIGAGLSLAGACDLRLCDREASFALPAARLGLGYDFSGIERLVRLVGDAMAREILFTGARMPAARAQAMGLVHEVCEPADLAGRVEALAERIRGNAPLTLRAFKACLGEIRRPPGERDVARCEALIEQCNASDDYREGRKAFAERRDPEFRGR
ncbi:MAG: enoyl-CoA hydratase [Gammaproteobacteria bacterium]|nr:enoyl-CoA hydratase [Gammaproteobacteria bacterium]